MQRTDCVHTRLCVRQTTKTLNSKGVHDAVETKSKSRCEICPSTKIKIRLESDLGPAFSVLGGVRHGGADYPLSSSSHQSYFFHVTKCNFPSFPPSLGPEPPRDLAVEVAGLGRAVKVLEWYLQRAWHVNQPMGRNEPSVFRYHCQSFLNIYLYYYIVDSRGSLQDCGKKRTNYWDQVRKRASDILSNASHFALERHVIEQQSLGRTLSAG